jgi:pimeloyl-ACP methyl ester carboxylesterase
MLIAIAKLMLKFVPVGVANLIVRTLAAMTRRPVVLPAERAAIMQSSIRRYGKNKQHIACVWGQGPLVIFVHGWGGRAAQLAPLAFEISNLGYRCVTLDVTGHGDSPKHHSSWDHFLNDITALSQSFNEEIYAYVGHSAGALAMMAARALRGVRAQRYVCICAPFFPYPPISVIQKKLQPKAAVLENYKKYIASQFEFTWAELESGCAYANAASDTLLIYDETDRFVNHGDADKIVALCPGVRLIKTNAYSHLGILASPELATALIDFLQTKRV